MCMCICGLTACHFPFVAFGDNGEELWWLCPLSDCWEEYIGGDDQNCEEEGNSLILPIQLLQGLLVTFFWLKLLLLTFLPSSKKGFLLLYSYLNSMAFRMHWTSSEPLGFKRSLLAMEQKSIINARRAVNVVVGWRFVHLVRYWRKNYYIE